MKKIFILIFITISFIKPTIADNSIIQVFYSGFSFSNLYVSNKSQAKFTSEIIQEKDPDVNIDIISNKLLKKVRSSTFRNIDLNTNNLLNFDKYPNNAVVMSVALQHEEFTQEFNYSTNIYNGFYDAYFQIILYDFSERKLIASIPFDFEIQMLSETKLDKNQILNQIRDFYLNEDPFSDLDRKINEFNIKRKYNNRIGVTKVSIQDRAFEEMPLGSENYLESYKNLVAQTFSKRLSKYHNIAIVPFMEGQAIGKSMKLKFVQSDEIYSIKLPNPDFHIHINLKGFKKVLAKSSDAEDLYLYGSFVDLKIFQPDLNKIYFDEGLRGVTKIKIPKGQAEVNDWRKYYYNLEILFNNFSKNIIKQDKQWLKETTKNKIKKNLKNLKILLEKVR